MPDPITPCYSTLQRHTGPSIGSEGGQFSASINRSIHVLMAATSYPSDEKDWKGLFIQRLAEALARRDDMVLRLWSPPGPLPDKVTSALGKDEYAWLQSLMEAGGIAHLLRNHPMHGMVMATRLLRSLRKAYVRHGDVDIRHVNWLQNAITLPRDGRPVLLTALGTDMQLLALPGIKPLLRYALKRHSTAICPNAEWMVEPLARAFGDIAHVQYVPFGIDPYWFHIVRTCFKTSTERWIVVSRLTRGKLGPLFTWCEPLFRDTHRELHLFGPMQEEIVIPDWVHYHGSTTPNDLAKRWFPQAYGLLTFSQHAEGRPQVMLEAMAAGLPIIASRLPAHEDLLHDRETGWLCDTPEGLAEAITALAHPELNERIGLHARNWTATHIGTWDDCAQRYVMLYRALQNAKGGAN